MISPQLFLAGLKKCWQSTQFSPIFLPFHYHRSPGRGRGRGRGGGGGGGCLSGSSIVDTLRGQLKVSSLKLNDFVLTYTQGLGLHYNEVNFLEKLVSIGHEQLTQLLVSGLAWPVFVLPRLDAEDLHSVQLHLSDAHWLSCLVQRVQHWLSWIRLC